MRGPQGSSDAGQGSGTEICKIINAADDTILNETLNEKKPFSNRSKGTGLQRACRDE